MDYRKLLFGDEVELGPAYDESMRLNRVNFGGKIRFYAPSFIHYKTDYYSSSPATFPSISITGSSCALNCKHCGGIVLRSMYPARSKAELLKLCRELKSAGAVGCLISGGCAPDGSVPLEPFLDALSEIKRELGLTLVVHTGIIDESLAMKLKEVGVDAALIDVIGSDETINEIYNLNVRVLDYDKSLKALNNAGIATVPHILVGLHFGELKGELHALEMVAKAKPSAAIVIAFMPVRKTVMEGVRPPSPSIIGKVLLAARFLMPSTPLVLGCMRPKGRHREETDALAVRAGVNAIAFPTKEAVDLARSLDYEVSFSPLCCSQIFLDIQNPDEKQ